MITKQELRERNSKLQEKIIDLFQFQNSLENRIIKDNKEIETLRNRIKRFKEVINKYRYNVEGLNQDCIDLVIDLRD